MANPFDGAPPEQDNDAEAAPRASADAINARTVSELIGTATSDGMFPLVAYGLDPRGRPGKLLLVTSSIPDMVLAQDMLRRFIGEDYNLGRFIPWSQLDAFARAHRTIVRPHDLEPTGFDATQHSRLIGTIARDQSASRWRQKGFGLVDISGFSLCSTEQQLAHRTSLALAMNQAASRVHKLYEKQLLPGYASFASTSTGDGFYFWHRAPGGAGDVAVFMLLLYVMTQAEAMRETRRTAMRLRGGFAVGDAYTFPSRELETFGSHGPSMHDAIGPVLNSLSRLIGAAQPGQVLVGDFARPGRAEKEEVLTPTRLIDQAMRQLLPAELSPQDAVTPMDIDVRFSPAERLRTKDKHGVVHYCWNVVGTTPNRFKGEPVRTHQIGLPPDTALDISTLAFAEPSGDGSTV